jgi:hypothetical protein
MVKMKTSEKISAGERSAERARESATKDPVQTKTD